MAEFTAAVLIISDRASRGIYLDATGPKLQEFIDDREDFAVETYEIVEDDKAKIVSKLQDCIHAETDLIITSGGTGISPRDVTPEATRSVIDTEIPGIGEMMRTASFEQTPLAALSRAIAGSVGTSLVINLPGSPKGALFCLEKIMPVLVHGLMQLRGDKH